MNKMFLFLTSVILLHIVLSQTYDYKLALSKSILFYNAQRSGALPASNPIPWRKNSGLNHKGANGENLTGGWLDAGDNVKFNFPMAASTTLLLWSIIDYKAGYEKAGQYTQALDQVRWTLNYFLKCHVSANEFYAQCVNGVLDHQNWQRPENITYAQTCYRINSANPGSDLAAEVAAAMAAGSIAFKASDPTFSANLLAHAKTLFNFANTFKGKYSDSVTDARNFYASTNYVDELIWAKVWIYKATLLPADLADAETLYRTYSSQMGFWAQSWDEKSLGVNILLGRINKGSTYLTFINNAIKTWKSLPKTPKGLIFRSEWGSLSYATTMSFLMFNIYDSFNSAQIPDVSGLHAIAKSQVNYALGSTGRSFVVGFGTNPPVRPHHRAASCPGINIACSWNNYNLATPNPNVLNGALVGGPDGNDNYADIRSDYKKNEVSVWFNAGYQGALARLQLASTVLGLK